MAELAIVGTCQWLESNAHTLTYAGLGEAWKRVGQTNWPEVRCRRLINACYGHYANLSTTGHINRADMLNIADNTDAHRLNSGMKVIGYSAKVAIEYFPRVKIPSYALWCLTLKCGHRYSKQPDYYGAAATFEDAKAQLQYVVAELGLDPAYFTSDDKVRWGEVKKLIVRRTNPTNG